MAPADGGDWNDAFGVGGLVVRSPAFSLSVNNRTRATSLRLSGRGVLPGAVSGPLGVPADAPIAVAGDLAQADGCVNVQVGDSQGTRDVLVLDGGSVHATYFDFVLAPAECHSAPTAPATAPGLAVAFDGSVMGYEARMAMPVTLGPDLVMDGSVGLGSMLVGPLRLAGATLGVHVNGASGRNEVDLSGGVSMLNTTVPVSGELSSARGITSGSLTGSPGGPLTVSGFTVRDLALTVPVQFVSGTATASVKASGAMVLLDDVVRVPEFTTVLENNRVETTSFSVDANPTLSEGTTAPGRYTMTHSASTGVMVFGAKVVLHTSAGPDIGFTERPAEMAITPDCAYVEGGVFAADTFGATVSGPIALTDSCKQAAVDGTGQPVTLSRGSYSLWSKQASIRVGGFQQQGSVYVGQLGPTTFKNVKTTLKLTPRYAASTVEVQGEFWSDGTIDLKGDGQIELAGFPLTMHVTAKGPNGGVKVNGTTDFGWLGQTLGLEGEFWMDKGVQHATFEHSLHNFNVFDFYIRDARFKLIDTPDETGFSATLKLGADGYDMGLSSLIQAEGTITFVRPSDGGTPLFHGSLRSEMNLQTLGGKVDGTLDFTNCDTACTQYQEPSYRVRGKFTKVGHTFEVDVTVHQQGGFDASTSVGDEMCTGNIDVGVARGRACIRYAITLRILSAEPYASLSASASADIQGQYWFFGWSDWKNVSVGVSAKVNLEPFRVCVVILGHDVCM